MPIELVHEPNTPFVSFLSSFFIDTSDVVSICALPKGVEESVWLLEHLRVFVGELNQLIRCIEDVCNAESCPVMQCTKDWEFLCAGKTSHYSELLCETHI